MKVLVIADLHWMDVWKKHVNSLEWDKVIFLWDYVDSYDKTDKEILDNLRDIIAFKRANPENVVLLLWNHDIQYIWEWNGCSWHRPSIAALIKIVFENDIKMFKIFHQEKHYLFSHAWITNWWLKYNEAIIDNYFCDWFYSYEDLNNLLLTHDLNILFQCWQDRGWFHPQWWPLWADKNETTEDGKLKDVTQVVWHTQIKSVLFLPHIIYTDCLQSVYWEPLVLNV